MDAHQRITMRAAAIVHEQLARRRLAQGELYLPDRSWALVVELLRKRDTARSRGWALAATRLTADLRFQLHYLHSQIERVKEALDKHAQLQPPPSQAALSSEIAALSDEFEAVSFDLKRGQISITTEPIELDGQYLGPFEIQLKLRELTASPCYKVVALDPHPAGNNGSVTHPHVQDGRLCEGDGHLAIRTALAEGRLVDFFVIVSQLLKTYARGKAYVELDDWEGLSCADCGDGLSASRSFSCEQCDTTVCDDCRESCPGCQVILCRSCIASCDRCDELCCEQCLLRCTKCQHPCCASCSLDGLCQACQQWQAETTSPEREHDDSEIQDTNASPRAVSPAV